MFLLLSALRYFYAHPSALCVNEDFLQVKCYLGG